MNSKILDTDQKALEINLNESLYGTFAEIGAGQEVARIFFKVGAAAGTIAKTMSAYDKIYSDEIYGAEPSGRYVCESRLYKMLDHEYGLLEERLQEYRPESNFFVFADTIAAINYHKTIPGNGWLGVRFQLSPTSRPNDLVIHVRMLDRDNQQQAAAIGVLGVNLLFACYEYADDPDAMVKSLMDGLHGRVIIDMVRLSGPDFSHVDNRYLSLLLVKHGLSEVAIFGPDGKSMHGSEFLYRKALMVVRGNFRPPTLVSLDVIKSSFQQFKDEEDIDPDRAYIMTELTLDNLKVDGKITQKDFLDRADLLCALGQTVIISNCSNHQKLINYLANYKITKLGLVIGVRELLQIINEKFYQNRDGRLLVAFGELFTQNIQIFAYPALQEGSSEVMTGSNLPVPEGIKFLYKYLLDSEHIVEVSDYNKDLLHIFPQKVLSLIQEGEEGWESMLPSKLVDLIKRKQMFGYPNQKIEVEL
jgi:hypothetical protein